MCIKALALLIPVCDKDTEAVVCQRSIVDTPVCSVYIATKILAKCKVYRNFLTVLQYLPEITSNSFIKGKVILVQVLNIII